MKPLLATLLLLLATPLVQAQVDYRSILANTYGQDYRAILDQKREYAEAKQLDVWADYAAIDHAPTLSLQTKTKGKKQGGYQVHTDTIILYKNTDALRHELGHALQRGKLIDLKKHSMDRLFSFKSNSSQEEIKQLTNRFELEVRLQSLNRVFFLAEQRPILTPNDALAALGLLGMELPNWKVPALDNKALDLRQFQQLNQNRYKQPSTEDAADLVTLLNAMKHVSHPKGKETYNKALLWVLENAPAHM